MKSRSTQTLRIDSVDHRVSVEQTITYNECPHHRVAAADSVRIAVSRNFFTYSDQENIVRYSQTNRVPGTGAPRSSPSNDLVHDQVTIIFVVSVCLFVCAEFFSAVFDPTSIKLGHMLYVWV